MIRVHKESTSPRDPVQLHPYEGLDYMHRERKVAGERGRRDSPRAPETRLSHACGTPAGRPDPQDEALTGIVGEGLFTVQPRPDQGRTRHRTQLLTESYRPRPGAAETRTPHPAATVLHPLHWQTVTALAVSPTA